ncbi:hypothetical protein PFAG_00523 [Plasmodium falciparum Santa Lucia]|uniref:Signal peptidase complex subunit 2 n=7 Tax=Plasmodium falciparum TaxID=5833 RepID=SPCS2_PLAF7|nr:signal peptidase complex subunit 2 [Plasmodium falciparum 3D7]Q9NFA0.1 RecName: Full=Signal peptidase complex subunit 2; Short=PfSPC25 [Plasmodium falciparum 3D7]ETW20530.1 hypothetical protein PFFVO_00582 [Plasmodium falciparum Vietnam Oak-Knoll (FVO)]ETW38609.1 hypothetical protein PFTANZ_00656 [Plasmodium falciparum Tanzania (2000708)]EUT92387.1 hypothetical protein PFAG_00523 [Plasmodium falciparum Santa Lucia]EWC90655.1 hypothetical protein PFNF54_00554 [Plasmodium falciparum NF54]KOB|eukprot:XP_001351277.1 signal peptidase complex subunit SPC2, putative [Plasmodium falciparum 3D7]
MSGNNVQEEDSTFHVSNLYSETEIKKITQDFISEKIREQNFEEIVKYSNIRIFLSLVLIVIGTYCSIFVQYKKNPVIMIQLLVAFFVVSTTLIIFEYFFFDDVFMILRSNNGSLVKLYCRLDVKKSTLILAYKLNKNVFETSFELKRLYNENGYLMKPYAKNVVMNFLSAHGRTLKLKN